MTEPKGHHPMITPERLDEIERGLVGVTPGPYIVSRDERKWIDTLGPISENGWRDNRDADASHFARMDPQTVAELVRLARIGMEREAAIKALGESNG